MRVISQLFQAGLLLSTVTSSLAASWTFTDATLSISGKASGVGGGSKEKLSPSSSLSKPIPFHIADTLKIILTTQDGKTAKRPHQAFLLLEDPTTNLDISYPFSVKESGKATVSLNSKDLPSQFQRPSTSLTASILIGSFGSSTPTKSKVFALSVFPPDSSSDAATAPPPPSSGPKPLRYGKQPEIHHIFRPDPRSPPKVISLFFSVAALATIPILLGSWVYLGGNINHISKALSSAPLPHTIFLGSIFGVEAVLFLYYTTWNLFQTLPVLTALGVVALISGSRALTEVQGRRLAGVR